MHRILILPDIRLILKPDTGYLAIFFIDSKLFSAKNTSLHFSNTHFLLFKQLLICVLQYSK